MSEHTDPQPDPQAGPVEVEVPLEERTDRPVDGPTDRPTDRPTGWHTVNVGHLVMGVALVGLAVVWLLVTTDHVDLVDHRWVLPLPWLAAGAAGLVATVLRGRRRPDDRSEWRERHQRDQQALKEQLRRQKEHMQADIQRHREEMKRTAQEWHRGPGH